jgi:hypothetical protein
MQNHFELPLFITVRASPWLKVAVYFVHLGAILALTVSNIPLVIQFLIISGLLTSLVRTHQLYISQKDPHTAVRLVLKQTGEWLLGLAAGENIAVTLRPMAFVHPMLVVMSFQADRQTYRVILTPDTVDPDTFRRLRVRLKFKNRVTSN